MEEKHILYRVTHNYLQATVIACPIPAGSQGQMSRNGNISSNL